LRVFQSQGLINTQTLNGLRNMNITKKDISKKIAHNSEASLGESQRFLDKFIEIISSNLLDKSIKIGRFGTFQQYKTKERIGRNPKTLKSYSIKPVNKIKLTISNKIKEAINWLIQILSNTIY